MLEGEYQYREEILCDLHLRPWPHVQFKKTYKQVIKVLIMINLVHNLKLLTFWLVTVAIVTNELNEQVYITERL